MKERKTGRLLFFLIFVSFCLKVYKVSSYPPLLWDEASLGYNAYSILKTGRDEHGQFLPLIFKSFGDYKPGLYVYLSLPFVYLLGLTPLAARLPSVLLGSLAPILLYFLVKEVFPDGKKAFFSALALTFLPWQIHFSRGAWEANCLVSFILLGSWLFLKSLKDKSGFLWKLVLSGLAFLFGLLVYQGGKLAVPLAVLSLLAINFGQFWSRLVNSLTEVKRNPKGLAFIGLIFLILAAAAGWYWQSFSGQAGNRLKVMSLFSYHRPQEELVQISTEDNSDLSGSHFLIFHGEWLHFLRGFATRYFNHLSPKFLAFEGDWNNGRQGAPYYGMAGNTGFVFLIIGLAVFLSKKHLLNKYLFLVWLLIFPLPAALTRDIITGVRSLNLVIPLAVFIGLGLDFVFSLKLSPIFKTGLLLVIVSVFLFDFTYYLDLYYQHMVKINPKQWLYGYRQAVDYINEHKADYDQVFMSNFYGQPYIYYLFYSKYPPDKYQAISSYRSEGDDVGQVEELVDNNTKVYFKADYWQAVSSGKKSLIIFADDEITRFELQQSKDAFRGKIPIGEISDRAMFYAYEVN